MKKRKERGNRYIAEYERNDLKLKLEEGIKLKIDLDDNLEVGVLLAKFRQAGLGSSRELGRIFRRSASTVINKGHTIRKGSKHLIDARKQKKRYKMEEIQAEILLIWVKKPMARDEEIFKGLQPRLSSLGMSLDIKTLKRHLRDTGIAEARSQLRTKGLLANRDIASDKKDVDGQDESVATAEDKAEDKAEEKEIRQDGKLMKAEERILDKEGLLKGEITQRMKCLDKVAIEKELFGLGGTIICDKREKRMTVMITSQGREYFKKALEIFLHQQNKKKVTMDYGKEEKYQLYFCLAPPSS